MTDYPDVPPGVRMFDPRRLRRHARKASYLSAIRTARREANEAKSGAARLASTLAKRNQDEARAEKRRVRRERLLMAAILTMLVILTVVVLR